MVFIACYFKDVFFGTRYDRQWTPYSKQFNFPMKLSNSMSVKALTTYICRKVPEKLFGFQFKDWRRVSSGSLRVRPTQVPLNSISSFVLHSSYSWWVWLTNFNRNTWMFVRYSIFTQTYPNNTICNNIS